MPTDATLGATVREALRLAKLMKADGVPQAEIDATLERTLRAAWPFIRTWKYLCETCSDTGWEIRECRAGQRCGRPRRIGPPTIAGYTNYTGLGTACSRDDNYTHTSAVPCTCAKGSAMQAAFDREFAEKPREEKKPTRRAHVRP